MRSPRRLSRPTTRERRRPRIEPSERPVSFKGIWTRRPSARIDGDVASIATIEQTQDWSPAHARPIRAVRAVYEAFRDHATSGRWRRGAPPLTSVGRPQVSSRRSAICSRLRTAIIKRPSVARRSLPHQLDPRVEGDSLPALSRLENDGGACHSRQDQKNPEGLSLQHPSHLINTSAGRRRG